MPVTSSPTYNHKQMKQLLAVARQAINDYCSGIYQKPQLGHFDADLCRIGACFVTLEVAQKLQGCIGSIIANAPLIEEVYDKAHAAACQDPRFQPLEASQLAKLTIEVSVLSLPQRLAIKDEQTLLNYLGNHHVGVILSDGVRRAVFLPQVWEQLPEPEAFLHQLKLKGGWPSTYWNAMMRVDIFTVTSAKDAYATHHST